MSAPAPERPTHRPRSSSIGRALTAVNTYSNDPQHHLSHLNQPSPISPSDERQADTQSLSSAVQNMPYTSAETGAGLTQRKSTKAEKAVKREDKSSEKKTVPDGLLSDIMTFRWMTVPASSAKLAGIIIVLWFNWRLISPSVPNPFEPFIFLSHKVPTSSPDDPRYQKGYCDLLFLTFYVIVFSCIRQTTTIYLFKPFAEWWGLRTENKKARFMEQGYAILYWGTAGALGIYVMSSQKSWWYRTEHFWLEYPHWAMRPELKAYYLLQLSFWLQQALVMLLRLEKPRKDYYELIAHHLVTLWLVGWSYLINLTMIGTTVFVAMDIPDTWLATAKQLNYMGLDTAANTVFAIFMGVWSYFRIYLSAYTLWSVWNQFDLIPTHTREWNPEKGWWLVPWMKYQIFAPLFLLLLLNLFWYYLMWRIMIRAITGQNARDVREEEEDAEDEVEVKKEE